MPRAISCTVTARLVPACASQAQNEKALRKAELLEATRAQAEGRAPRAIAPAAKSSAPAAAAAASAPAPKVSRPKAPKATAAEVGADAVTFDKGGLAKARNEAKAAAIAAAKAKALATSAKKK